MSSVAMFEAAAWVKSMYDKIMIENQKEKLLKKKFVHKVSS